MQNFWELEPNRRICFFKKWAFVLAHFWPFWANFRNFWPVLAKLSKNVSNLTISLQKSQKKLEKLSRNQKRQICPPKCPKTYPEPKMAPKTVEGGQIWLKYITGDLTMMIRDKNNIFERVKNFHADLAWNYPGMPSINSLLHVPHAFHIDHSIFSWGNGLSWNCSISKKQLC